MIRNKILFIEDIARCSPLLCIFFFSFYFFLEMNIENGMLLFFVVCSEYFNKLIKRVIKQKRPLGWWSRSDGCGLFRERTKEFRKKETYGMPSGHIQTAVVSGLFFTYLLFKKQWNEYKYFVLLFVWICIVYIGYSRVKIGCHSIFQVIIGSLVGLVYGLFVLYLIEERNIKSSLRQFHLE